MLFDNFDTSVLAALLSSTLSVILALLAAFLEFPKHYYIYQMNLYSTLQSKHKLKKIGQLKNSLSKILCEAFDQDYGFLFVENIYFDANGFICLIDV